VVVYSWKGERLAEHSYLVLRLYCGIFGQRHEKLIANRLNVDIKPVSETTRIACILHDVGKALKKFQLSARQGGSFRFHEVISAFFTYDTLCNVLSDTDVVLRYQLSFAAAYAVIQHHQAMRGGLWKVLEKSFEVLPLDSGIDEGLVDEIAMAVQMTTHLFDASKALEVFKERVEEVSKQGLKRKLQEFKFYFKYWINQGIPRNIHSGKTKSWGEAWEKLQLTLPLFVAPLQLCDHLAAFITRGGKGRRLHREALSLLRRVPLNLS
jgi:CRISPR-associated endonuclease Cas3-HD